MGKSQGRIREISNKLCEEFQRAVPLHANKFKKRTTPSERDIESASEAALKRFYEVAREEKQRYMLGIIGRARVAFDLQQRLLQAGYPAPLVKQVLFALLASVFVGRGKS